MKRFLCFLLLMLCIAGCARKPEALEPYTSPSVYQTEKVDVADPVVDPYESKKYPYYSESHSISVVYYNENDGCWYQEKEKSTTSRELSDADLAELIEKNDVLMQLHMNEASENYIQDVPEYELSGFYPSENPGVLLCGQIMMIGVQNDCLLVATVANVEIPSLHNVFSEFDIGLWIQQDGEWVCQGCDGEQALILYAEKAVFYVAENGLVECDGADDAISKAPCEPYMAGGEA